MLSVTIYEWRNGQDRIVGKIRLVDDHLEADPRNDPLLLSILSDPVRGNKYHPRPVAADEDPRQFLENLHISYRTPYLRASRPKEEDVENDLFGPG